MCWVQKSSYYSGLQGHLNILPICEALSNIHISGLASNFPNNRTAIRQPLLHLLTLLSSPSQFVIGGLFQYRPQFYYENWKHIMACGWGSQEQRPWASFSTKSLLKVPKTTLDSVSLGLTSQHLVCIKLLSSPF